MGCPETRKLAARCFSSIAGLVIRPVLYPSCTTQRACRRWHLQSAPPPTSKGSERRMRSPSPSLSSFPSPPPPEFSDPLRLPGREEGEDKFLSVPEHRALYAQTQQGTGIRGVRGMRRALESSKSLSREPRGMVAWTQTWVGYLLC